MNKCMFVGRLTRDSEVRFVGGNKAVCDNSIAINNGKDKDGNERTTFVDLVFWDKRAEFAGEWFKKGTSVWVECRAQQDVWETENKEKRSKIVFVVENSGFAGSSNSSGKQTDAPKSEKKNKTKNETVPVVESEDIPF